MDEMRARGFNVVEEEVQRRPFHPAESPALGELIMPQREFDITIGKDGKWKLHVKGYKGKGCLDAVKIFEEIVGELKAEQKNERILRTGRTGAV